MSSKATARLRVVWTFGWAVYLFHVAAAFSLVHDWSHAAALAETARQTRELTGVESGSGLWLNYFFTLLWTADVAWWWKIGSARYLARSGWIDAALHGFFLFMIFNATVVFETGVVRWGGAVLTVLVVGLAVWSMFARGAASNEGTV